MEVMVWCLDVKLSCFMKYFLEMFKYCYNFLDNVKLFNVYGDINMGYNNDGFVGVVLVCLIWYLLCGKLI